MPFGHTVMDEEWGHAGPTRATETCTAVIENATKLELMATLAEAAEVVWTASPVHWDRPDAPPVKVMLKDAAGAPLELVPYGLAKFRITMFPLSEK